jgi:hypothetical protein
MGDPAHRAAAQAGPAVKPSPATEAGPADGVTRTDGVLVHHSCATSLSRSNCRSGAHHRSCGEA